MLVVYVCGWNLFRADSYRGLVGFLDILGRDVVQIFFRSTGAAAQHECQASSSECSVELPAVTGQEETVAKRSLRNSSLCFAADSPRVPSWLPKVPPRSSEPQFAGFSSGFVGGCTVNFRIHFRAGLRAFVWTGS